MRRCDLWFCFRRSIGYISVSTDVHEYKLRLCKKHEPMGREVIEEIQTKLKKESLNGETKKNSK